MAGPRIRRGRSLISSLRSTCSLLLDKLGIRSIKAMGVSSGGKTLLHMATQQPDRIEQMVLIGATSYFPEQARVIARKSGPDSLTTEVLERERKIHVHGDEQIRQL